MIPELDQHRITRWVEARNAGLPDAARDKIRYELDVTATTVTILGAGHRGEPTTDRTGRAFRSPG